MALTALVWGFNNGWGAKFSSDSSVPDVDLASCYDEMEEDVIYFTQDVYDYSREEPLNTGVTEVIRSSKDSDLCETVASVLDKSSVKNIFYHPEDDVCLAFLLQELRDKVEMCYVYYDTDKGWQDITEYMKSGESPISHL